MRRQYAGGAKPTTLAVNLGGSTADLSITGTSFANYPDGSVGPFYIVIDRGEVSEEKILCVSRSGNVITVYNTGLTNGRGNDGTSVVAHSAGATIEHVFTSVDADEANSHVNNTTSAHGLTIANVVTTTGTQTLSNKTISQAQITNLTTDLASKVDYALPVNAQTGTTYTFVLADGTKLTTASNASASTYTIPPQSSVVWATNSVLRIINYGAGAVTIAGGVGVTVTNATKTLLQFESAALIRTAENAWTLVPFGGVPDLDTAGSRNIQTFTGSGSYTIPQWARKIDYLIVGGGNSGISGDNSGARGGGNGGQVVRGSTTTFTRGGSITITIGAGGVTVGGLNNFGTGANSSIVIPGGSTFTATGGGGASGGGAGSNGSDGTLPTAPFNFAYFGGGGGGAAQDGSPGWRTNGGNGGGGLGAQGNFATAGRANTGGGGGGGAFFGGPANGGSGIVVLYFS